MTMRGECRATSGDRGQRSGTDGLLVHRVEHAEAGSDLEDRVAPCVKYARGAVDELLAIEHECRLGDAHPATRAAGEEQPSDAHH